MSVLKATSHGGPIHGVGTNFERGPEVFSPLTGRERVAPRYFGTMAEIVEQFGASEIVDVMAGYMPSHKTVRVGPAELAMVRASGILALDAGALGGSVRLRMQAPEAADDIAHKDPTKSPDDKGEVISVVRIEGPLAQRATADLCAYVDGYDAVAARFEAALTSEADSVLMVIDSPGGDVAGLSEAVDRMRRAKAASTKNVVVYVDEMAASAAYWIAAGVADEIVVPSSGRVGSIGCIGAFVDESGAWKREGVEWHVVRDPAGKADMMPAAPLTELATARLRESVEASASAFIAAVAGYRGVSVEKIRGLDAAMLPAATAVAFGLADRVGTLEDASARASALGRIRRERKTEMSATKLLGLGPEVNAENVEAVIGDAMAGIELATGATGIVRAAAVVSGMRDTIEIQAAALVAASEENTKLRAQVKAQSDAQEQAKIAALVDELVTSGRMPPVKRAAFEAKARENGLAWAESTAEFLPALVSGREAVPAPAAPAVVGELSDREIAQCKAQGIDLAAYVATKAALAARNRRNASAEG